jgi:hypothetical protein
VQGLIFLSLFSKKEKGWTSASNIHTADSPATDGTSLLLFLRDKFLSQRGREKIQKKSTEYSIKISVVRML